jgi:hypothetical protein
LESVELLQNAAGPCVEQILKRRHPEDRVIFSAGSIIGENEELKIDVLFNSGCNHNS